MDKKTNVNAPEETDELDSIIDDILSSDVRETGNEEAVVKEGDAEKLPEELPEEESNMTPEEEAKTGEKVVVGNDETTMEGEVTKETTPDGEETTTVEATKTTTPAEGETMPAEGTTPVGGEVEQKSDMELLAELEGEIKKAQESKAGVEQATETIKDISEDGKISRDEYNELVNAYNQIEESKDMLTNELKQVQQLVGRYRDKVNEQSERINQTEIDSIATSPIVNTVQGDNKLKGFVLTLNKAKENPEMKPAALNFIYDWLEGETGVNIKDTIQKELDTSKRAVTGGATTSSMAASEKMPEGEKDILSAAIPNLV